VVPRGGRRGALVGVLRQERIDPTVPGYQGDRLVGDAMDADAGDWRIGEDASLEAVLGSEGLRPHRRADGGRPNGVLRGVVTIEQVRRALHVAAVPSPPAA